MLTAFVFWELHTDEPMLDIRYFRKPAFSTGTGGMILVFMAMYGVMFLITQYFQLVLGYTPAGRGAALPADGADHDHRGAAHPAAEPAARREPHRRRSACAASRWRSADVPRPRRSTRRTGTSSLSLIPLVSGMALAMSPMTAAIMSAVPARRAGAGSAMNDATRELGAALGIAVMGSVAASQYTHHVDKLTRALPAATQHAARTSLADALEAAGRLPGAAGQALATGAQHAFIDGVHLAVTIGSVLALIAAVTVYRYLPHATGGRRLAARPGRIHGGRGRARHRRRATGVRRRRR